MTNQPEIIQLLTDAKVPPRPMVPRLSNSVGLAQGPDIRSSLQESVTALVRKYEDSLVKVVLQERHRKLVSLQGIRERSVDIMNLKNQEAIDGPTVASSMIEPQLHLRGSLSRQSSRAMDVDDNEEDDIMLEDMSSNPSSPEGGKDEGMASSNDEDDEPSEFLVRKRKVRDDNGLGHEDGVIDSSSKKLIKEEESTGRPSSATATPTRKLSDAQLNYIRNGVGLWEKSRGAALFGQNAPTNLMAKNDGSEVLTWICDQWNVSSLRGTEADAPLFDNQPSTIHVLALSSVGLHHYSERSPLTTNGHPARNLDHWSLIEIEQLDVVAKEDGNKTISLEMCGLVSRRGRDIFGERVEFKEFSGNDKSCASIVRSISMAHQTLMQRLQFKPKFELESPSSLSASSPKSDSWIDSTIRMFGKLFGVNSRTLDSIDCSVRHNTLTVSPPPEDKEHSVYTIGAVMRALREYDQCSKVRFEGVKITDGGWKKAELIKELERMTRDMKQIDRWNFARCGWGPMTVKGFLRGFETSTSGVIQAQALGQTPLPQAREPCRRISLADNDFGGDDSVGRMLARSFESWRQFRTLDLTNCNIGLAGMEALVFRLENMYTIRIQGNQSDDRWWPWMDKVLDRNPSLQKCRLGAPRAHPSPSSPLLPIARLRTLQELTVLDLSTSPVNASTLEVLEAFMTTHQELLTLTLARCGLTWASIVPLFMTLCSVNKSTKFTLDVSQNPLFDQEISTQRWTESIQAATAQLNSTAAATGVKPFGIHMQGMMIRDPILERVLQALESATCFNEVNVKGLLIQRESEVTELQSLSYDAACQRIRPGNASRDTCLALGRVLAQNTTLVMLDISGKETLVDIPESRTSSATTEGDRTSSQKSVATGGFGRDVHLAFPGLAHNETLRILTMDHNRFGEGGMVVLAEALKTNRCLGVLSCDGNDAFTHKGLKVMESVLPPVKILQQEPSAETSEGDSSIDYEGTMEDAQAAGYNSTLSVWCLREEEVLLQKQFMTMEVKRLLQDYDRVERLQARNRDQEAKYIGVSSSGSGAGGQQGDRIGGGGAAVLSQARRRWEGAVQDRADFIATLQKIVIAVKGNNRRTKVHARRQV